MNAVHHQTVIPLVLLMVIKYFGLKVHFEKMNSTLSKLVTTASALQSITRTLTNSEQFHITDLTTIKLYLSPINKYFWCKNCPNSSCDIL